MTYDPRRDSLDPEFRPLPPEARGPEYDGGVSTNVSATPAAMNWTRRLEAMARADILHGPISQPDVRKC